MSDYQQNYNTAEVNATKASHKLVYIMAHWYTKACSQININIHKWLTMNNNNIASLSSLPLIIIGLWFHKCMLIETRYCQQDRKHITNVI